MSTPSIPDPVEATNLDSAAETVNRYLPDMSADHPLPAALRIVLAELDRRGERITELEAEVAETDAASDRAAGDLNTIVERLLRRGFHEQVRGGDVPDAVSEVVELLQARLTAALALVDKLTPGLVRLRSQRDAALALHSREEMGERVVCGWCRDSSEEPWEYPCPTVRALTEETDQ